MNIALTCAFQPDGFQPRLKSYQPVKTTWKKWTCSENIRNRLKKPLLVKYGRTRYGLQLNRPGKMDVRGSKFRTKSFRRTSFSWSSKGFEIKSLGHFRYRILTDDQGCPSSVLVQISSRIWNFSSPDSNLDFVWTRSKPDSSLDLVWTKFRFCFLKLENWKNLKFEKIKFRKN